MKDGTERRRRGDHRRGARARAAAGATSLAWMLLGLPLAAAEAPPSRELLEFLGSFETAAGKWIDPTRLEPAAPDAPTKPDVPAEAEEKEKSDE